MKKILLLSVLSVAVVKLNAQAPSTTPSTTKNKPSLDIAVIGSGNSTWLLNDNIGSQGKAQDYAKAWGYNYGLGLSFYFPNNVGIGLEATMGSHTGGYAGTIETKDAMGVVIKTDDYKSSVQLKYLQIPLFLKLKSDNGVYFEVGPQYNMISSANYKRTGAGVVTNADTTVTSAYAKTYFSAAIGFGGKFKFGTSPLAIMVGIRLNYSLTDLKGVDALGQQLNDPFVYTKTGTTAAASGGIILGFIYQLGNN